jgi:2-polyprenyl-3-methyl-5-hydroxy-6-metoxy-1,4-benzoquinol methylase
MTYESQYSEMVRFRESQGVTNLGIHTSIGWEEDPKRLVFHLARYKFVAKLFKGFAKVLEVGCGDGFASRIVRQSVDNLDAIDIDPIFIADAIAQSRTRWNINFSVHDMLRSSWSHSDYDGIFLMDVLEHIKKNEESIFIQNVIKSLKFDGIVVIGMPSIESQKYASPRSKAGHVNCKSGEELRDVLLQHFKRVTLFSMNDEVVHTGFYPLAHYLIAVCSFKIDKEQVGTNL